MMVGLMVGMLAELKVLKMAVQRAEMMGLWRVDLMVDD